MISILDSLSSLIVLNTFFSNENFSNFYCNKKVDKDIIIFIISFCLQRYNNIDCQHFEKILLYAFKNEDKIYAVQPSKSVLPKSTILRNPYTFQNVNKEISN